MLSSSVLTLTLLAFAYAADREPIKSAEPGAPTSSQPVGPAKQIVVAAAPPRQYAELLHNVDVLAPQYQYPGLNYVPDKQLYPRVQPPVVFYAGAAPPGQQFLYRPGSPPGNFLVPQPQPQPDPGVIFGGGNPPGPLFVAGYPRPAHIPPIEKDAEEIPTNLAGNHPPTRTGRPTRPQPQPLPPLANKPEKLETFDEPVSAGEVDDLAKADKDPNNVFPRKPFPSGPPSLKPGQHFFILNGNPLYSNFPLQGIQPHQPNFPLQGVPPTQPNYQTPVYQPNLDPFIYRQPQYVPELQPQQFHQVPIQDLFLRNSVTGQISDVKPALLPTSGFDASLALEQGNFISLNSADDFRNTFLLKNAEATAFAPEQKFLRIKEYELPIVLRPLPTEKTEPTVTKAQVTQLRVGKERNLNIPVATFDRAAILPTFTGFDDYYRYAALRDARDEDDSVVIEAKAQNDDSEAIIAATKPEQPALSQAQPSAIALAGNGGVASAAPKGTALAGIKGLAVARPQATAVAGPSREEPEKKTKGKKERQ